MAHGDALQHGDLVAHHVLTASHEALVDDLRRIVATRIDMYALFHD